MSEFTDGLLILKEHAPLAQTALTNLTHPYIFKNLNEKWSVIVFEDANPQNEPVHSWIVRHSKDFPMLWFSHSADDGWGYELFHAGERKAAFEVSYNISIYLVQDLAEQLHPGIDFYDAWATGALEFEPLHKQVEASEAYNQRVASQYINPGVEEFAVFGFSSVVISRLHNILRPEFYSTPLYEPTQVDLFQKELDLEEMSWVSYHYLCRDTDEEEDYDE
jgi:hypothetical protein